MAIDVLIDFLSAGLLDVKGDDTKLEKLQTTAADLSAALKKTPSKSAAFALIAFDPSSPATDPVIQEAVEALQNRWATYINTFSDTPVTVIRALLLDALSKAASEDDHIGIAFISYARNALPFMEAGNESKIWGDVVAKIERQVNARAEAEWTTPESISVSEIDYVAPTAIEIRSAEANLDKKDLEEKFFAAAAPNDATGQPTQGNPYLPNNNQNWINQFVPRIAEAIYDVLGEVIEGARIAPVDLSEPLQELADAVSTHVDKTLQAVSGATAGLQRRTSLIWWKETLYSPSVQSSYRDMSPSIAAALMAFDLHQQIPIFSPASVAAFLHETVLSLPDIETQDGKPIRVLLEEALQAEELAPLRDASSQFLPEPTGRGPLLGILGHGFGRHIDDDSFRNLIGISAESVLTIPQWATWIFRELQAARAMQDGTGAKKRGRKS
ncbi:GTPase-associated system all-helical protein GASH [Vibrio metschnikovii]|uniref:GTPase-associated system all-helical protein GASH n=1 Tax=Vibrio metschnikovii TaxID=28172 RepID=UPI001C2FDD02|nr:GTPase-associated system all-helical protein GASH [Vibrio metschnikovii]